MVKLQKSATNATDLDTLHGSAVRLTGVTSAMAWVILPETVLERRMNPCAIIAARVDTLLGSVLRVVARAKLVTTVVSKDTLVVNALIPRMTARTMEVVLTKIHRYTTDHYYYFLLVHTNYSAYTKEQDSRKMVLLLFFILPHKKRSIKFSFP